MTSDKISELEDEIFKLNNELQKWYYMLKDYRSNPRSQCKKPQSTKSIFDFLARRPPPHEAPILNQTVSTPLQLLQIPQQQKPQMPLLSQNTPQKTPNLSQLDSMFSEEESSQQSYSEDDQPFAESLDDLTNEINVHNKDVKNIKFNKAEMGLANQNMDDNIKKYFPKDQK